MRKGTDDALLQNLCLIYANNICFRMIFECLAFFAQAGGLCGGQRAEELPYFISHPNPSGQQLQQNLHNNVYLLLIHFSSYFCLTLHWGSFPMQG